jgi:hypothetical protein
VHFVQAVLAKFCAKKPSLHAWHAEDPVALVNVFKAQSWHADDPAAEDKNLPAAQGMQMLAEVDPVRLWKKPSGQVLHVELPLTSEKVLN